MDIMNAILDIEQKAREIVSSAEELEKNRDEVLNDEIKRKEDDMLNRLNAEREAYRQISFSRCREEMERLEKSYAEKLESIDEKCGRDKEKWIAAIVDGVVGGS